MRRVLALLGRVLIRAGLCIVVIGAVVAMTGCAPAYNVRAPICEPPPLPASAMTPCEEPDPLASGRLEDLYVQAIRDTGPWGRCIRAHDRLIELVKYRDAVCAKIAADNAAKPDVGWRWPWQK